MSKTAGHARADVRRELVPSALPRCRVVVFAIPDDSEALLDVLSRHLGLNPIDARIHLHGLPGVLADPLEEEPAAQLAAAIRALGVEAISVAEEDLPDLGHVEPSHHVRCTPAGLECVEPTGAVRQTLPWEHVALISVADVPLDATHHVAPEHLIVVHAGPGRVRPAAVGTPPVRGAEMWVVCEQPFQALRIDHRAMNYEYLGNRMTGSAAANFELFLKDVAAHAMHAYWTPTARAFRARGPAAEYRFDSAQAHQDATVRHILLMRRMRRGVQSPPASPQPIPPQEAAMNPRELTLISGPLKEAHEALQRSIQDLRQWWRELEQLGKPRFGEMGTRVHALRELLSEHFRLEEEGGYLKEPLNAAPHRAPQAQALRADHTAILADLERLARQLEAAPCELDCWTAAWHELAAVLARLERHEHEENEFWQTAIDDDVGAAD